MEKRETRVNAIENRSEKAAFRPFLFFKLFLIAFIVFMMKPESHPFAANHTGQLQEIVDLIVHFASPEKIWVLGISYQRSCTESVFVEKPLVTDIVSHYYLLVLSRHDIPDHPDELCRRMEALCRPVVPVTVLLQPVRHFREQLVMGDHFSCLVYKYGYLAWDTEKVLLPMPLVKGKNPVYNEFAHWHGLAAEFLAGAQLFRLRKQRQRSAFFLYQAAEQALMVLVQLVTGLRAPTQDLKKLIRFSSLFSTEAAVLFPGQNEQDRYLFRLLQKAYIYYRHHRSFAIRETELVQLMDRVQALLDFTRAMAKETLRHLPAERFMTTFNEGTMAKG